MKSIIVIGCGARETMILINVDSPSRILIFHVKI